MTGSALRSARFYWVVTVSGAVIMALEILSIRILSPTFGNSVYVWGSIISVFLAALSIGYIGGGALADRSPSLPTAARLLMFAAVFQVLLLVAGGWITERLGVLTGDSIYGPLLATLVLFGPPTVLLATVSPFALKIAAANLDDIGGVAGRLYALSTAGSLFGTLGCTFILIPFFELATNLILLLSLTLLTAIVGLSGNLRAHAGPAAAAVALLVVAPLLGRTGSQSDDRLAVRITPYQTLEVVEQGTIRTLLSDGVRQSAIDQTTGEPTLSYARHAIAALLAEPDISDAVVLGLGGGTFGRYLQSQVDGLEIDFVEIDPDVVELAEDLLGFETHARARVHVGDGRRYLASAQKRWDLIFCDTYVGLSVPFHLATQEFYELTAERLTERGVLMVNFAADLRQPFTKAVASTISSVYKHVYLFSVSGRANTIMIASNQGHRMGREELLERAADLDATYDFEQPTFTDVARGLLDLRLEVELDELLRDDFAPVDRLIHLGR